VNARIMMLYLPLVTTASILARCRHLMAYIGVSPRRAERRTGHHSTAAVRAGARLCRRAGSWTIHLSMGVPDRAWRAPQRPADQLFPYAVFRVEHARLRRRAARQLSMWCASSSIAGSERSWLPGTRNECLDLILIHGPRHLERVLSV